MQYTPMIEQYLSIKKQHEDAFLFFRLGDFYELFFTDAEKAAKELEITLTARGSSTQRVPMCGVPYHSAKGYIERLVNKGYKVAICEQVENPDETKGIVRREVTRIITPGVLLDEGLLAGADNNFLVAIVAVGSTYALAAIDFSTGESYLTEVDTLEQLWSELSFYQPREILLDEHDRELQIKIASVTKALVTPCSAADSNDCLFDIGDNADRDAIVAARLLYAYLVKTQRCSLRHLKTLRYYQPDQYLFLDNNAKKNLEIFVAMPDGKRYGSLFWHLNQTVTSMGARLLKKWLEKPLLNRTRILLRQASISELMSDASRLDTIRQLLRQCYDLERLTTRVACGVANARDLNALKITLQMIPPLCQELGKTKYLQQLIATIDACEDIVALIERSILKDPSPTLKEGNLICSGFDTQLDELQRIEREAKTWLAELESTERLRTGIKTLKVGYNRVFGYYFEVSKTNAKNLPAEGYQRKQTLSNAERFVTAELKEKEELILTASARALELEYELFIELREQIAVDIARLQKSSDILAKLDVFQALATVAQKYNYVRPLIHETGSLNITDGRHPVVEALGDRQFIANDVELSDDRRILLITGPNMAGKSTYMRQLALIVILGQMGSFVPATKAELPLVDRIFTRIGAAEDLIGGKSTFMVEMSETCQALTTATPRSLMLLDEIGRGTSTYDGISLAQAIVEYIHDHVGAMTLFSTHYHELIKLKLPTLVNLHAKCIEENGEVLFLYRIVPGGIDRSYGIHVAELAGLPAAVIDRAKVILSELESTTANEAGIPHEEIVMANN